MVTVKRKNISSVILISTLLSIFFFYTPLAFSQNISFKRLTLNEGLSEITCFSIKQDSIGRIWVGTRDGLNCWDGIRMKTYNPIVGDTTTIHDHRIIKIHINGQYLWAQSAKGLSRLDFTTMKFHRLKIENLIKIGNINGNIYAGTTEGLYVFDQKLNKFIPTPEMFPHKMEVTQFYQDKHGDVWICSAPNKKLFRRNSSGIEEIDIPVDGIFRCNELLLDSEDQLWIATRFHGLITYQPQNNSFSAINLESAPYYLNNLDVRSIIEDKEKRIWVGTFKGLTIFDLNERKTRIIDELETNRHNISHNSVYSLYLSKDNNIWVGTYFGGVNYGKITNEVFKTYHDRPKGERISHYVIGKMIEDKNGNIWIATEGSGIDFYDAKTNKITNYNDTGDTNGPSEVNIKELFLANDSTLMIGTYKGGLNIMNLRTKKFKHYNQFVEKDHPVHVNAIIKFNNKFLLGAGYGVHIFDPITEEFTPFFPSKGLKKLTVPINDLFLENEEKIWIATAHGGLYSYNLNTTELKNYRFNEFDNTSIALNSINCILKDRKNRLWLGTDGGGLCLFNPEDDNFTTYNHDEYNLPSNFVYGIAESNFENLWISTSKGLSRFDIANQKFYNYTNESGFPLNELNYHSLLLTQDNQIFVGGVDGMISFYGRDLLQTPDSLKIHLTSLSVNNQDINAGDASEILSKDISFSDEFTLKPNHSAFTIGYSAFNYNSTFKNKYRYWLEGFDKTWVNAEFESSATYTNLNPGKYLFKVQATDVNYNPISNIEQVRIKITPPFFQNWYAYTFYGLLIIGIVYWINRNNVRNIHLRYQLKREIQSKEQIKELDEQKYQFFINISHEFLSPLTLIISSLESAFDKFKIQPKLKWHLNLALKNAKRLRNLNTELLEFSKIEKGYTSLSISEHDIVSFTKEIYSTFKELANHKKINYSISSGSESILMHFDPHQMGKVFYNLLSNAFKNAPETTGEITVKIDNEPSSVKIQIQDNGQGIPAENLNKIFNRYNHISNIEDQSNGVGLGLALSRSIVNAHKGEIICESILNELTSFTVTLLKGNDHFDSSQLVKKTSNELFTNRNILSAAIIENNSKKSSEKVAHSPASPTLLIIESNAELKQILKTIFENVYNILFAKDVNEGISRALNKLPDIIIIDSEMSNISGFELCKKIKRNQKTLHIPVILVAGNITEEDQILALKCGSDAIMSKPFSAELLKEQVRNLLSNRNKTIHQSKAVSDKKQNISETKTENTFLIKATSIVESNITNSNFGVDQFAEEMKHGRTLFFAKLKKLTGQTPNDFILSVRLKKASEMLMKNPEKNINEVAAKVGFKSPKYFSTAFKKHFGVTPSKYLE